MKMKLQLLLAHSCAACGEIRDEEEVAERLVYMQLFGVVWDNVCPKCYRELELDEREAVHEKARQLDTDEDPE